MLRRLSQKFETTPDNDGTSNLPPFLTSPRGPEVAAIIESESSKIHNDSLLKIVRQLDFWYNQQSLTDEQFVDLTRHLVKVATWREEDNDESSNKKFTIPKVRFGKTEVNIPIVTCGGMRVQET